MATMESSTRNSARQSVLSRLSLQSFTSNYTIDRESKYLATCTLLSRIRLFLSALIFTASIAIIACEGDALSRYNSTHLSSQWWLPLWPNLFDLRPTKVMLACASIIAGISLVYIIAALIPSPHSHHTLLLSLSTAATTISLTSTITALAYVSHLSSLPASRRPDTIESWTCKWSRGTVQAGAPGTFARMCREEHAAFDLMAMLVAVEALRLGAVGVGWWVEIKNGKSRREGEADSITGKGSRLGSLGGLKEESV